MRLEILTNETWVTSTVSHFVKYWLLWNKNKQQQSTSRKKKSSISELPTLSLLPTSHSSAIQEEPQRFFLLFIIPSIRAGNYHTGWRAVLTTQHSTGIAWGGLSAQATLASKTSQVKMWQIRALLSPAPPHSTNVCQEWPLKSFQNLMLLPALLHSYKADILLEWAGMKHCRTRREWLL